MSEWPIVRLGDLAASSRNALVGGPFGSNLTTRDFVASGVPVIQGKNMGGRWVTGDFVFVGPEKAASLSANIARPGDVIFTQRGTLGQVSVVPVDGPEIYVVSQSQMKLSVDRSVADPMFVYYVFTSAVQKQYMVQQAIRTGVPHTNLGILREATLRLPPIVEQRAIADILGALDDRIESNRRVALFARACIDGLTFALRDLPLTALSSLAAVSRDVIDPATLTTGSVEHFSIPAFDVETMPERTAPSSIRSGKFAILGPRVLVSRLNPGTPRVWYAVPSTGTGLGSTEFLVLDHPMHDSLAQIWLAVTGEPFTHEMQRRATGTSGSHQRVGPADAMAIEVPDTRLTDERVLAEADALLRLAHQARVESQALGALRDALRPELLSGRLRVPEAREQVEAVV